MQEDLVEVVEVLMVLIMVYSVVLVVVLVGLLVKDMVMELMIMMVEMVVDQLLLVVKREKELDKTLVVEAVEPSVAVEEVLVTRNRITAVVLVAVD